MNPREILLSAIAKLPSKPRARAMEAMVWGDIDLAARIVMRHG
jgi:hypothetical protein